MKRSVCPGSVDACLTAFPTLRNLDTLFCQRPPEAGEFLWRAYSGICACGVVCFGADCPTAITVCIPCPSIHVGMGHLLVSFISVFIVSCHAMLSASRRPYVLEHRQVPISDCSCPGLSPTPELTQRRLEERVGSRMNEVGVFILDGQYCFQMMSFCKFALPSLVPRLRCGPAWVTAFPDLVPSAPLHTAAQESIVHSLYGSGGHIVLHDVQGRFLILL